MLSVLLLCFADLSFASFYRQNTGAVIKNYVYKGSILAFKTTDSFFACSHFCLSFPDCFSFNYESSAETRSLCELHSFHENVYSEKEDVRLTFQPGFVFVQTNKHMPHSCADHVTNGHFSSGRYDIYDSNGKTFPVYCDMSSEPGSAWTLILSVSLERARTMPELSRTGLIVDSAINEDNPNWNEYRLSLGRMLGIMTQSILWRITCSIERYEIDYRDYVRANITKLNPLTFNGEGKGGSCKNLEFINVRGHECRLCSAAWWQETNMMLHHDSSVNYCDFGKTPSGVDGEDNFGYYEYVNNQFRCTANNKSTTNYWFGKYT